MKQPQRRVVWAMGGSVALAVCGANAVAAPADPAPASPPVSAPQLVKARPQYWLKLYSTAPRLEYWVGELTVKRLDDDLPRIVAAVAKEGGALTQDLKYFV